MLGQFPETKIWESSPINLVQKLIVKEVQRGKVIILLNSAALEHVVLLFLFKNILESAVSFGVIKNYFDSLETVRMLD